MTTFPEPHPDYTSAAVPKGWMDKVMRAITELEKEGGGGSFSSGRGGPPTAPSPGGHWLDLETGNFWKVVGGVWKKAGEVWFDPK